MATNFDRWEKDPFFSAAEEVQESADRMESTYRTWIHTKKDTSGTWNSEELCRDLRTALGTCKWQLEEFERAAKSSYVNSSSKEAKGRHREFIIALESQISKVENSLHESAISAGKPPLPWVHLDEGESNELALFLSGSSAPVDKPSIRVHVNNQCTMNQQEVEKQMGHRRTASASADIGVWKIAVTDDVSPKDSLNVHHDRIPRKVPSYSGFLNTIESVSKVQWSKNGYGRLKLTDGHQEADTLLPKTQKLTRGINASYETSKSSIDGCDDCYDKQLYGWYGAIQRQLQRSQYQMQYSRPIQVVFSIVLLLCMIVIFVFRAI